ncbi:RRM domain-containing protein [Caenorhabditis elegans]|uniref:RRM domain-containing protein n=1 Tax=Caenorhabditis elegans TaxID=6239 RepID=Q9XWV4_CAEEL|nr:RRM domain-containing protein [Caenorhabditis elegans]CAA21536.2 RRM domain-containing protein [Caenorhabditis elegans]|eukprot:NP_499686.2 RNA Binding Motif protein homolog [Caenorhabditis elegans]
MEIKPTPSPPEERTIYVANFSEEVDEELLEELFIQAGPVVKVILRDVRDSNAKFALVEFEDELSVLFAIELMNGVRLFNQELQVKPRNGTNQEELYKRKKGEIEERVRSVAAPDRDGRRDSYRDDRNRNRNGNNRDSWQQQQPPRHHRQYDPLPPPPPPPLMGGSGGHWRSGGERGPPQYSTPQMLPHQHFVNQMMQQQINRSAPPYNGRHQNSTPHRHHDRHGYDRSSSRHHRNDDRRRERY